MLIHVKHVIVPGHTATALYVSGALPEWRPRGVCEDFRGPEDWRACGFDLQLIRSVGLMN